jgi:peroxiredoxin
VRLRERRGEIERAGGALAGISVDAPSQTAALEARLAEDGGPLGFPLLCDGTRQATRAFGVYDSEHDIALPAVVILGADGRVAWKHVGESITDRPEEDDVIAALEALRGGSAPPSEPAPRERVRTSRH